MSDKSDSEENDIEHIIADITSIIRSKRLKDEYKEVEKALLSEERTMEYKLVAKMAWSIYQAIVREGFSEQQAFELCQMTVEGTVFVGLKNFD